MLARRGLRCRLVRFLQWRKHRLMGVLAAAAAAADVRRCARLSSFQSKVFVSATDAAAVCRCARLSLPSKELLLH